MSDERFTLKPLESTEGKIIAMNGSTSDSTEDTSSDDSKVDTRVTDEQIEMLKAEQFMREESEADAAKRIFKQSLLPAVQSIVQIAQYSNNERLRYTAAQYVVERNIGRLQDTPPEMGDDPLDRLLASCVEYIQESDSEEGAA